MNVDLLCRRWFEAVGRQDIGHADGEKSQHKTENPGATTGFALTKDVPFVSCSAALVDHDHLKWTKSSIKSLAALCCCLRIALFPSAWLDRACGFSLMAHEGVEKPTMGPEITTQPDGSLRVCLTESGITACCYVSSTHLVDSHLQQLRESIFKQALRAYEQPC